MRRSAKCFIHHIKTERNLSPRTVSTYRQDIDLFIAFVERQYRRGLLPGQVTADMIQAYLEFLASEGYVKRNQPASRVSRTPMKCHSTVRPRTITTQTMMASKMQMTAHQRTASTSDYPHHYLV